MDADVILRNYAQPKNPPRKPIAQASPPAPPITSGR